MNSKKPIYKRKWFIVIVVLIIIGGIGSALTGDNEGKKSEKTEQVAKEESKEKEVKDVFKDNNSLLEYLKEINPNINYTEVEILDADGDFNGRIQINVFHEGSTIPKQAFSRVVYETLEALQDIKDYESHGTIQVVIWSTFMLVDGNEKDAVALNAVFAGETVKNINLENLQYADVGNSAEIFKWHSSLQ